MNAGFFREGVIGTCVFLFTAPKAYAQGEIPVLQVQDLYIIFGSFVAAIVTLVVYISRDAIFCRKNTYDYDSFDSQKNRDYEKYHSKWGDEWWMGQESRRKSGRIKNYSDDYYEILGVKRDATKNEIKIRYRELVKVSHPDRVGSGNDDRIVKINRAYEVLSDKMLRKEYDSYLTD